MRRPRLGTHILVLIAILMLPHAAQAQRVLSAPDTLAQVRADGDTTSAVFWVEDGSATTDRLLLHNRSEVPLHVSAYAVSACVGLLLPECRTHAVAIEVAPHSTAMVGEIRSRSLRLNGYRYRLTIDVAAGESLGIHRLFGSVGT
jgi:hypothetical protein